MPEQQLDTDYPIETPEGVVLNLQLAGPVVRAMAWLSDFFLRLAIYTLLSIFLARFDDLGSGLLLLAIFLLEWFYPVFFEIYADGATPGKKRFKIKVLHSNGVPVSWTGSMLRNLLRTVDILPFFYGFGLSAMLLNAKFQRLGDMAADTIVVYTTPPGTAPILLSKHPLPLPCQLNDEEQRAVLAFAERAPTLGRKRVVELANLATPLTDQTGQQSAERLQQFAKGLYQS
ncbi:RDD family protein [Candidatus Venteria ishoeyi]|uniref:RDD family protein n=1 Tax=Candidatus Venteria ishoeyi TaxID=1899563 RepID=UPI0025A656E0|nr:RDD family protein [Candidatus Venteria ishoeyi]MDM8546215.1 RDD family protein [Candidatus Venteria ishoeyi]